MNASTEKLPLHTLSANTPTDARHLGTLLLDMGKIQPEQAEQVLRLQKESGLRFGEAAVKLGFITEQDVQQALARQYDYPYILPGSSPVSEAVVAAYQPFSHQVEALRAIRSQLMVRWLAAGSGKVLAVLSPNRKEGRSYLAANLSVVFSQLGERTLLIDADMRNPRQHVLFGLDSGAGLSTLLAGRAGWEAMRKVPGLIDLSVLPAGPIPPNPGELVTRPNFGDALEQAARQFDVVIVDVPAAKLGSDAEMIAVRAGSAVMIVRSQTTRASDIATLRDRLMGSNTKIVGSVFNDY
jgi:protein-tyrosine kinase